MQEQQSFAMECFIHINSFIGKSTQPFRLFAPGDLHQPSTQPNTTARQMMRDHLPSATTQNPFTCNQCSLLAPTKQDCASSVPSGNTNRAIGNIKNLFFYLSPLFERLPVINQQEFKRRASPVRRLRPAPSPPARKNQSRNSASVAL